MALIVNAIVVIIAIAIGGVDTCGREGRRGDSGTTYSKIENRPCRHHRRRGSRSRSDGSSIFILIIIARGPFGPSVLRREVRI